MTAAASLPVSLPPSMSASELPALPATERKRDPLGTEAVAVAVEGVEGVRGVEAEAVFEAPAGHGADLCIVAAAAAAACSHGCNRVSRSGSSSRGTASH